MKFTRPRARSGAATLVATLAIVATASSAHAVDNDLTVSKTADATTVQAGDTVGFTVEVDSTGAADGVTVADTLPDGLTYVDGSSKLVFTDAPDPATDDFVATSRTYSTGSGWDGPWVETNDDGSASSGIIKHQFNWPGLAVGVSGTLSGPAPTVTREVTLDPTATTFALDVDLYGNSTGATEQMTVAVTFDDGATTVESEVIPGGSLTGVHTVSGAIPAGATTASVSISLDAFTYAFLKYIYVNSVEFSTNAAATVTTVDPAGALADLTNGATYDMGAGDNLTITYDAVVDDVLPGDITTLTNSAVVSTTSDAAAGGDDATLTVTRHPALAASFTLPSTIEVGDDLPVTLELSHAADSDGADVCSIIADMAGFGFALDSGDDGDSCLEYGETWTMSAVLSGMTDAAGAGTMAFDMMGTGTGQSSAVLSEQVAYTVVLADTTDDASDDAAADDSDTEELAATGPSDAALGAGVALLLLAAGSLVLIARRRVAHARR